MRRAIESIGEKFGLLTVTSIIKGRAAVAMCACDCGNTWRCLLNDLRRGKTKSCGCAQAKPKHGLSGHPLYQTWISIKSRTMNPSDSNYWKYGKRGVSMFSGWVHDAEAFINYVLEHLGPRPTSGHSIDRIKNEVGYAPGNIRWATVEAQQNNRTDNRFLSFNGETLSLTQWARKLGFGRGVIDGRLANGWSIEDALTKPVGKRRSKSVCTTASFKDND